MKKLLLILTIFILPNISLAYQWPIDNSSEKTFNQPQKITATLGEYRPPNYKNPKGRLHVGVDVNPTEGAIIGTEVHAVEVGEIPLEYGIENNLFLKDGNGNIKKDKDGNFVINNNTYVRVISQDGKRIFNYLHIKPDKTLVDNWDNGNKKIEIKAGQLLGTIKKLDGLSPHLHFEENGFTFNDDGKSYTMSPGAHNPITNLTPYHDTAPTQIYADSLEIRKDLGRYLVQATQANLPINDGDEFLSVSGKVSIKVKLKDEQSLGRPCVAPYQYGYMVYNYDPISGPRNDPNQNPRNGIVQSQFTTFDTLEGKKPDSLYDLKNKSEEEPKTLMGCQADGLGQPYVTNWITQDLDTKTQDQNYNNLFQEDNYYWLVIMADDLTGVNDKSQSKVSYTKASCLDNKDRKNYLTSCHGSVIIKVKIENQLGDQSIIQNDNEIIRKINNKLESLVTQGNLLKKLELSINKQVEKVTSFFRGWNYSWQLDPEPFMKRDLEKLRKSLLEEQGITLSDYVLKNILFSATRVSSAEALKTIKDVLLENQGNQQISIGAKTYQMDLTKNYLQYSSILTSITTSWKKAEKDLSSYLAAVNQSLKSSRSYVATTTTTTTVAIQSKAETSQPFQVKNSITSQSSTSPISSTNSWSNESSQSLIKTTTPQQKPAVSVLVPRSKIIAVVSKPGSAPTPAPRLSLVTPSKPAPVQVQKHAPAPAPRSAPAPAPAPTFIQRVVTYFAPVVQAVRSFFSGRRR